MVGIQPTLALRLQLAEIPTRRRELLSSIIRKVHKVVPEEEETLEEEDTLEEEVEVEEDQQVDVVLVEETPHPTLRLCLG